MMTFPTEWKNNPNVPNHQPAINHPQMVGLSLGCPHYTLYITHLVQTSRPNKPTVPRRHLFRSPLAAFDLSPGDRVKHIFQSPEQMTETNNNQKNDYKLSIIINDHR
jgi:uncharacterized short protein YbdD (DUF466 family)